MTFRMGSKKQLEDTWLSYMRRAEEADLKFKKSEAQWKKFKRQLSLVHWEHDFTRSQLEILSTTPKTLVMKPRRFFHQKQFFMMKADYYALLRDGPINGNYLHCLLWSHLAVFRWISGWVWSENSCKERRHSRVFQQKPWRNGIQSGQMTLFYCLGAFGNKCCQGLEKTKISSPAQYIL